MGKCIARLLANPIRELSTPSATLPRSYACIRPTRRAFEAQTAADAINCLGARLICLGPPVWVAVLAASPPHKFSFRPNLGLGTHTVIPYPARSHSPVRQARPLLRPALSSGLPLPFPATAHCKSASKQHLQSAFGCPHSSLRV